VSRWTRRAVTGPAVLLVTALVTLLLAPLLGLAALFDVFRRRPWSYTRFVLAIAWAAWMHVAGMASLWGSWLLGGRWLGRSPDLQRELDLRAQGWWARQVWRGAAWVYALDLRVAGADALDPGGFVLMSRHASLLDTILPLVLLADARGHRLRYVIKRELLWDPCVDIAGDRFPTAFVRRGGGDHEVEIARVASLLDDLGPHDVVVIYPEGTRFSATKRERVLRSLARKQPEVGQWAAQLRHVLPPHPGGSHVLLRSGEHDVVFCAHTGLEPANHFADLVDGSLLGKRVQMRFWRVAASELPADDAERERWLRNWWERIDNWIDANREGQAGGSTMP
jgi:1-acyl-sn-glycerol-3-phosphate acyltransferase